MEVGPLWFLYLVASLHSHNLCRKGWYNQHSHNICGNSNSHKACGNDILWQIMPIIGHSRAIGAMLTTSEIFSTSVAALFSLPLYADCAIKKSKVKCILLLIWYMWQLNTPIMGKKDLHAMKKILYDMDHLKVVRWLIQRSFKFKPPIWTMILAEGGPPPKIWRKKIRLGVLLLFYDCSILEYKYCVWLSIYLTNLWLVF